jgi:tRNA modification GTPase
MSDTIFALSSGQGKAGIAVVRMSGPAVRDVFRGLCGKLPPERVASLTTLRGPADGKVIDRGLGLFFAGPRSFTGEDMGEFHVHGGRAVVAKLLGLLEKMPGLRVGEPGEFTRRAFVNGKLDLVEVEALGDVISAETEEQLRLAQRLALGELSGRVESWRSELVSAMALVEALIDFSDEGDVGMEADRSVAGRVQAVLAGLEEILDDGGRGERLRDGVTVVIAGPPNAGKSTLLNLLAQREAAIVSPFAGTTRDPIEVHLDLGGVPVTLVDTAGLREVADVVEAMGVERARDRVAKADLVLWLEPVGEMGKEGTFAARDVLRVGTKLDLAGAGPDGHVVAISAVTGVGVEALLDRLTRRVGELAGAGESVLIMRARQREALSGCAAELRGFLEICRGEDPVLQAERLRLALRALGRLTGRVDVEEVLGEIFAGFCIGK